MILGFSLHDPLTSSKFAIKEVKWGSKRLGDHALNHVFVMFLQLDMNFNEIFNNTGFICSAYLTCIDLTKICAYFGVKGQPSELLDLWCYFSLKVTIFWYPSNIRSRDCFLQYCHHKFRSAFGKTKVVRHNEKVLVAFSVGQASSAMLHLLKTVCITFLLYRPIGVFTLMCESTVSGVRKMYQMVVPT